MPPPTEHSRAAPRVLIAPDAFKGSLTARETADAMAAGVRDTVPGATIDICPLADGGEGTLDVLLEQLGGQRMHATVTGPLGNPVTAQWGWLPETRLAIVELASAAGLPLVPDSQRDPGRASTLGVGELILTALAHRPASIQIALGGSATNDGGAGLLQALGARLADDEQRPIPPGANGLHHLEHIDLRQLDPRLAACRIEALCDVRTPLCGRNGATATFGPQKGLADTDIGPVDRALLHYARLLAPHQPDAAVTPGCGAAGGTAFALAFALGARLVPGADRVLAASHFEARLAGADCVITGEGRLDEQIRQGKLVGRIAALARDRGRPAHVIAGSVALPAEQFGPLGITTARSLEHRAGDLHESMTEAPRLIRAIAAELAATW